jgi:hypothetical protein
MDLISANINLKKCHITGSYRRCAYIKVLWFLMLASQLVTTPSGECTKKNKGEFD